jgi:hypothetical protein
MIPASVEISDEAVRRWHELLERRAALAATRCSCGCRCDAGRPRPGSRNVGAVGGVRDPDRRRPA